MSLPTPEEIKEALKQVIDPELHIDIVNLGLIYDIRLDEAKQSVDVDMTLTAPGCPMGPQILTDAYYKVKNAFPQLQDININLVWVPFWNQAMMSEEAKDMLGYF
jgi:metal-sulfur cluster biosynthetic enzyme